MIKKMAIVAGLALVSLMPTAAHAQQDNDSYVPNEERSLDVSGWSTECIKDAPWVEYSITTLGFVADPEVATLTIRDIKGNTIEVKKNVPFTGRFLYPGAEVDEDGNATDWPGWEFDEVTEEWIELGPDEGDTIYRKGLVIRVDVNPTGFAEVSYPDASPLCAGPQPGDNGVSPEEDVATGMLPSTGSDGASVFLQVGALLLVGGMILAVGAHRRRSTVTA